MIYRAKKQAVEDVHGDNREQYAGVWDYAKTLRKHNLNSWVKVGVDRPKRTLHPKF